MAITHAATAGAGLGWLKKAIGLVRRHPKPILGGAAWMLAAIFGMAFASMLLSAGLQMALKPGPMGSLIVGILAMLPMLYVFAAMFAGYLRLVDKVESGQAPAASEVFSIFGDSRTCLRAFGLMVVMVLLTDLLFAAVIALLAPEVGTWYMQTLGNAFAGAAAATPPSLPAGFGVAFAVMLVLSLFSYSVQAIGFGQVVLGRRNIAGALADGLTGTGKNLLPLLVLLLASIGLAIVAILGMGLIVAVLMLLVKFVSAWILIVLVPIYLLFLVVMFAITYAVVYHLWREVCGSSRDGHPRDGRALAA